jgi:hypothetical protein
MSTNDRIKQLAESSINRRQVNLPSVNASVMQNFVSPKSVEKIKTIRQLPIKSVQELRNEAYKNRGLLEKLKEFCGSNGNLYLTFGGTGDLVLLLGECYNDKSSKVIYFANEGSVELANEFIKFFNLKSFIHPNLMGTRTANHAEDVLIRTGRLKTSAHLAKNLDYADWKRNTKYYEPRLPKTTDWISRIGKNEIYANKKVLVICPTGSVRNESKQRYLTTLEYLTIVTLYLKKGWTVFSTGSEQDTLLYPAINDANHFWITSTKLYKNGSLTSTHPFIHFLKIINSATEVISVDTWLKTYTLLAGIPTKVIESKFYGAYLPFGHDPSDFVFLNKNVWPHLSIVKPESILENIF